MFSTLGIIEFDFIIDSNKTKKMLNAISYFSNANKKTLEELIASEKLSKLFMTNINKIINIYN
jgi:vacuolar-type H+-ATPase catalytic subunit A/Vma1